MKNFLLLIFALASVNLSAQIWSDDFEDGDISDWTISDVDGDGNAWFAQPDLGFEGSVCLQSESWSSATQLPLNPDNFASSPAIDLTAATGDIALAWKAYGQDQDWAAENYQVWISTSTDPADIAANGEMVFEETLTAEGVQVWFSRLIDISAYAGQVIHVTFRHVNVSDQFRLNIDDVSVLEPKALDGVMSSVVVNKFNALGATTAITGSIFNDGLNDINTMTLGYSFNGGAIVTQTFDNLSVPYAGSYDFTFDEEVTLDSEEDYIVDVTIIDVNGTEDDITDNNMGNAELYVVSQVPSRKIFLEEATGTWCGFCPRGAEMLEAIVEEDADVIGVAVHNSDPMEIAEYDDSFSFMVPGYPSMLINREPDNVMPAQITDYQNLVDAVNDRKSQVSPASMDVTTTILPSGLMSINVRSTIYAGLRGDYRFNVVVTEDSIRGTSADYAQVNYYSGDQFGLGPMNGWENLPDPVPASDMVYNHVAIAILGGFDGEAGSLPDLMERNTEYEYNFAYNLGNDWLERLPNIHVIGMIIDDQTREVLNANTAMLPVAVEDVLAENTSINVFPNPATNMTSIELTLEDAENVSVELFNHLGQIVRVEDYGVLSGNQVLNLSLENTDSGMYMIQMKIGKERYTHKLQIVE